MRLTAGSADYACPGPGFADRTRPERPDWGFLAEEGGRVVARVGFAVGHDPDADFGSGHPDPALLTAALRAVPQEVLITALDHLPGHAGTAAGALREALPRLGLPAGTVVEARANPEAHPDADGRRRILTAAGLTLFQEKLGYSWTGDAPRPHGLTLTPVTVCGVAVIAAVMSRCIEGTLDRNDRYYLDRCGPQGWARVMIEYLEPEAGPTWCVAADEHGEPVGFVAVSAFDEPDTATIVHVGVVPEQRGHGHGHRLVLAATALAAGAGSTKMISDVDVDNGPMRQAFLAAGHRDDARPWHVWHYRTTVAV